MVAACAAISFLRLALQEATSSSAVCSVSPAECEGHTSGLQLCRQLLELLLPVALHQLFALKRSLQALCLVLTGRASGWFSAGRAPAATTAPVGRTVPLPGAVQPPSAQGQGTCNWDCRPFTVSVSSTLRCCSLLVETSSPARCVPDRTFEAPLCCALPRPCLGPLNRRSIQRLGRVQGYILASELAFRDCLSLRSTSISCCRHWACSSTVPFLTSHQCERSTLPTYNKLVNLIVCLFQVHSRGCQLPFQLLPAFGLLREHEHDAA